ncbi:MAG: type III secretion inner membrane ring lipoprotein SctJ [Desulfovibrio sp.]|jgi:type III secretion protein J|nr:type III secretion inner membrane ring lipoprotein SctJ [Desulfovibrio sp.]
MSGRALIPRAPGRAAGVVFLLVLCLLLGACRVELYRDLTESTANELLSALLERGIVAEKVSLGKTGFAVEVDEADQLRALEILRDLGLPKPVYDGLGTVFRKEGMMSSPMEERARFAYALSQEIAASCARLDGVVDARAHVVLGERDVTTGSVTPASAAVMLRYAPEAPINQYLQQIQQMVVQSVPDVAAERVSVLFFPVMGDVTRPERPVLSDIFGIKVLRGSAERARTAGVLIFLAGVAAGCGGLVVFRRVVRGTGQARSGTR